MTPTSEWLAEIRARNRQALGLSGLGAAPKPFPWGAVLFLTFFAYTMRPR